MDNVIPMRDLMVVVKDTQPAVSSGGILLPGAITETNTARGTVISTGPGALKEKTGDVVEIDVRVGDIVLFHNNSGIKVSENKELPERWLLREEDILAIVVE